MKYVLAHHCDHEDHDGDDDNLAYLHEEEANGNNKVVKVFQSKSEALDYMKANRWSPNQVMVVPHQEGIWNE